MAIPSAEEVHAPISGSCLCQQVTYTVKFPPGSVFPPDPHTCQCTQCRKWASALVVHLIGVKRPNVVFTKQETLSEYESSPGCFRAFCKHCGSPLYWRSPKEVNDILEICTGTLDDQFLVCEEGKQLCIPTGGRFWSCREIAGVTSPEGKFGGGPDSASNGRRLVEGSALGKFMD